MVIFTGYTEQGSDGTMYFCGPLRATHSFSAVAMCLCRPSKSGQDSGPATAPSTRGVANWSSASLPHPHSCVSTFPPVSVLVSANTDRLPEATWTTFPSGSSACEVTTFAAALRG